MPEQQYIPPRLRKLIQRAIAEFGDDLDSINEFVGNILDADPALVRRIRHEVQMARLARGLSVIRGVTGAPSDTDAPEQEGERQ